MTIKLLGTIEGRLKFWMDNGGVECWCTHPELYKRNDWFPLREGKITRGYSAEASASGDYVHGFVVDELGNATALMAHDIVHAST